VGRVLDCRLCRTLALNPVVAGKPVALPCGYCGGDGRSPVLVGILTVRTLRTPPVR